jgi:hypothetical protein
VAAFNLDDYEPVEKRLGYKKDAKSFWEDNPDGRILTQLLDFSGARYIVQAFIFKSKDDEHPWATGLAEETIQGRGVNATSALENAETSAIGRALATAGYATKGKRPSREEMTKVATMQATADAIAEAKAKMATTAKEYVPVAKEDDPWTIKDAAPVSNVDEAVALVKEIIGGQTEKDIPHCPLCQKEMEWKTGTSKAGKHWGKMECKRFGGSGVCNQVIWYEISKDGTWVQQKAKW